MDAAWVSPEIIDDGDITQTGYVQATADRESSQEAQNGDKTHETDTPERPEKPRRKRGRIARDPLNQTFLFECRDADDMETSLRDFLKDTTSPPEHTTVEFRFPASAAFMVYPSGHSQAVKDPLQRIFSKKAVSVIEALQPTYNPKDQVDKQRSIAKICVETVAKADGFKYGFNNNWISKEDGASRFSYFCNDSSLNKARAGNPAASNRVAHKKAQKQVYECEGTVAVKFYNTKQMLEVLYKHIPCHSSYAARAPIPRKGTRRRLLMEVFEPDKLPTIRTPGGQGKKVKYERQKARLSIGAGSPSVGDCSDSAQPDMPGEGSQQGAEKASTSNEIPVFPAQKLKDLQNTPVKSRPTLKKRKAEGSNIPGTLSGFMDGDEIHMGEEPPNKKQASAKKSRKSKRGQTEQDAINFDDSGIVAPGLSEPVALQGQAKLVSVSAASINPPGQPSELAILKAKLAQAEQQIQRLEAAKGPAAASLESYYYAPPGYYQQPPPQDPYPSQQQWQPYPGYVPPPQPFPEHYAAPPGANIQFKNKTQAAVGARKPSSSVPSSPGSTLQLLAGIAEAAAGASERTGSSSRDNTNPLQTVNRVAAAAERSTIAGPNSPKQADTGVVSPPDRTSPSTSADTTKTSSEPETSTPAPNIANLDIAAAMGEGTIKIANNHQRSTLASRVASSMGQPKHYAPKLKRGHGPS